MGPAHGCGQESLREQAEEGTCVEKSKEDGTVYLGLLWGWRHDKKLELLISDSDLEVHRKQVPGMAWPTRAWSELQ